LVQAAVITAVVVKEQGTPSGQSLARTPGDAPPARLPMEAMPGPDVQTAKMITPPKRTPHGLSEG